jgi:molybdopterin converting factor small subunit
MNVQLKLFATLRQYLPPGSTGGACNVQIPAGSTVGDMLSQFGVPLDEHLIVVLHGRRADWDQALQEGDVVSAFPAMSGG